jgi:adenylosuccinate lyase
MRALWGDARRIGLWRRLWLALMEAQRDLGLGIPEKALAQLRANLDTADLARAAEYERRFRHDVMAHIHHLGDQAPAARPFLHLGATSAYVTDNADLVLMREGMALLVGRLGAVLVALAEAARRHRAVPCLAYTHYQPAQLTTVGKRVALWAQDFALDAEELLQRMATLPFRGAKGTTGTQASFLDLFDGDGVKVRELDRRVAAALGFERVLPLTGQTYTRKVDAQVLAACSGIAASAAKFATDLRLLQHDGEMLEPFESEQVGSSAMPYKRNPMRAERMCSLARRLITDSLNGPLTAATQWLERSLDDSANRRLVMGDSFLTADAILGLAAGIAGRLEAREETIAARVARELPFMATETFLLEGTVRGGDRQELHERIRRYSLEAYDLVSRGEPNTLVERIVADPAFGLTADEGRALLDPARFVGRAPRQVDEFLDAVVGPAVEGVERAAVEEPRV